MNYNQITINLVCKAKKQYFFQMCAFLFTIPSNYIYMVYCVAYVNQEHASIKNRYAKTNPKISTTEDHHAIMYLRALQILNGLWHKSYRYLMHSYSTAMIIGSTSISIYGVVKFQDISAFKLALMSLQFWFHLYADHRLCGKLHENSLKFFEEWTRSITRKASTRQRMSLNSKVVVKQIKSTHPFRVYVGASYFLRIESLLVAFDRIVNITVTLLFL